MTTGCNVCARGIFSRRKLGDYGLWSPVYGCCRFLLFFSGKYEDSERDGRVKHVIRVSLCVKKICGVFSLLIWDRVQFGVTRQTR